MGSLSVNGATLAYDDVGAGGPAFVFVHGWICDRTFWRPQFDDLSRDHRCLAFDLRGCGHSSATPPYDVVQAADDLAAALQSLSVGAAIVCGHSLGGLVALLLNERHPEAVLGIVLGDSPLSIAPRFSQTVEAIRASESMSAVEAAIESLCAGVNPPELHERIQSRMKSASPEVAPGMLDGSEAYAPRLDDLVRLADQKPLMAIWAARPLGDPAHLRDVAVFIRQEPMPGASHFFQLEKPELTNALLRAFLDDVERDPRIQTPS